MAGIKRNVPIGVNQTLESSFKRAFCLVPPGIGENYSAFMNGTLGATFMFSR